MADEQPTDGEKSEIDKMVDSFFSEIELASKNIATSLASFVSQIFSLKVSSAWEKERELIKDRIKKGLTDNGPKS